MRKLSIKVLLLVLITLCFNNMVTANSSQDVFLKVTSKKEEFRNSFTAKVTIEYSDKNLYNNQNYISYHVYDKENNELLWEGKRLPFEIDKEGKATQQVEIDLKSEISSKDLSFARITFDIVDEKNEYWYSTNPNINFSSDAIIVDQDIKKRFTGTLSSAIFETPVIFGMNFLCFILFICLLIRLKKSEVFSS